MVRKKFDLAVVIPMDEEFSYFRKIFTLGEDLSKDRFLRFAVKTDPSPLTMVVVKMENWGKDGATKATLDALNDFDVSLVVCLGIAGSLSSDAGLASVVCSQTVIDVWERNKIKDKPVRGRPKPGKGVKGRKLVRQVSEIEIEYSPTPFATDRDVAQSLNWLGLHPELDDLARQWKSECEDTFRELLPDLMPPESNGKHLIGAIVCGPVSASTSFNERLRKIDRKMLAIETESGGVFSAANDKGVMALTIRGVSDLADTDKNKLEAKTGGRMREVAARNAASFLKYNLSNKFFVSAVRSGSDAVQTTLFEGLVSEPDPLRGAVSRIAERVDEKLRELSAEYRVHPKGYALPIPRISETDLIPVDASDVSRSRKDLEMMDVLQSRRHTVIQLPKFYPDRSLSWLVANSLLPILVGERQPLPVVINVDEIRLPARNFESVS